MQIDEKSKDVVFSIIMPCYNSEDYVAEAINSVKNQTYHNWELIIINDGSTDHTLEIINKYSSEDGRIKVFSKENGGYVSAVNAGLKVVSGEYFMFLGSDDALEINLFNSIYNNIAKLERLPDCIAFRTKKLVNGVICEDSFTSFDTMAYSQNSSIAKYEQDYPAQAEIFFSRDTSKCFKTSILNDISYYGKYGLDADGIFSMRVCHNAKDFMSIPVDGYFWTIRYGSVSSTTSTAKLLDRLNNWLLFFSELNEKQEDHIANYEKQYITYYYHIALSFSKNIKNSFKHPGIIRKHLKFAHKLFKTYGGSPKLQGKLAIFSPIIYSVLSNIYSLLFKKK